MAVKTNNVTEFVTGNYTTSNGPITVVKELKSENKYNADGTIARTYGTWNEPSNYIKFEPGKKVQLTKELILKSRALQKLIKQGTIVRTL